MFVVFLETRAQHEVVVADAEEPDSRQRLELDNLVFVRGEVDEDVEHAIFDLSRNSLRPKRI